MWRSIRTAIFSTTKPLISRPTKNTKLDHIVYLEHGKPLVFGKDGDKGILIDSNHKPKVVKLGSGISEEDLLIHDENDESLAFLLSRMTHPDFPEPMGVFYSIKDDCYEDLLNQQVHDAIVAKGGGTLEALFNAGDTYTVEG